MKIAVITDSGTGWSEEQAKEKGLFYLPLQVKCGDEEFLDGIDITVSELYERLRNGEMPTTSMPPLGRVEALFAQLKEEGYEYVIAVPPFGRDLVYGQHDRSSSQARRASDQRHRSVYDGQHTGVSGSVCTRAGRAGRRAAGDRVSSEGKRGKREYFVGPG